MSNKSESASEPATVSDIEIAVIVLAFWITLIALGGLFALGSVAAQIEKQINSRCVPAASK